MQTTEKYVIIFAGIHLKEKLDLIQDLWYQAADTIYQQEKIYVDASISSYDVLCRENYGCHKKGMEGVSLTCIRNSSRYTDAEHFSKAVLKMFQILKNKMENVYAVMEYQTIQMAYFVPATK